MDREPANKSMGFLGIYKEAYNLTSKNKKIFAQITLTILLPLAFCFLSEVRILTYRFGWITISHILFIILLFLFRLWSTSSVMYTVAGFYTSREISYKKVVGVRRKLWRRFSATFFWCFFLVAIYTSLTLGLLFLWYKAVHRRGTSLIFISCLSIPAFSGLIYAMVVWNIATVVTVLEEDCYGRKALAKSIRLIKGKIWVSCAVFVLLGIAFAGIIVTYYYLSVYGYLLGEVFVGIGCHLLLAVWFHFLLVVHTVVYFVCKSAHEEHVSTISTHLEVLVIHLGRGEEVPLEALGKVPV